MEPWAALSMASEASGSAAAPPAYDDARVTEVEKLIGALNSSECTARWEGIKEAIGSWEQAFYLYPEIERRTFLDSDMNPSVKTLVLIRDFIRDEIVAMQYREKSDSKLKKAATGTRKQKSQMQKELERVISNSSEIFMKRIFAIDALLNLSAGSTLAQYISSNDPDLSLVASNVAVMRESYEQLDKRELELIKRALLYGIRSESFPARYFSLRSLEKLSRTEGFTGCVDPTVTPK